MKCEEFMDKLDSRSGGFAAEMREHISECADCRALYSVVENLTPESFPATPENIAANVLKKIRRKEQLKLFFTMKTGISKITASAAAAAIVTLGVFLIGSPSPARGAEKLIDRSLEAASRIKTMVMTVDVRTAPKDNFSCIGLDDRMVTHTLTVLRGNPVKWRLDKGWRCIVFDGKEKYMWTPDGVLAVKGDQNTQFEEWFAVLLDPEMILLREKLATEDKGTQYTITQKDDEIVMTARVAAKGDFSNPYSLNTSISESDTWREIVFDKQTELVKGLRIYVEDNGREVLIVDMKGVVYDAPVDEAQLTKLPEGVIWNDLDADLPAGGKFVDITADEAARMIFTAAQNGDLKSVEEAFFYYKGESMQAICKQYNGLKLIRLGKSFRSGDYPGVFVPCEVKLPNGKIERFNLALRNDNRQNMWLVDGGL